MAANYWIKLYQEVLRDPKMGRLSDSAYRRCIQLFLLAGEQPARDGSLPELCDIAWELRVSDEQLTADIQELVKAGIIKMIDERPFVVKFSERQAAVSGTERSRQSRSRSATTKQRNVAPMQRNGNESATGTKKGVAKGEKKPPENQLSPVPLPEENQELQRIVAQKQITETDTETEEKGELPAKPVSPPETEHQRLLRLYQEALGYKIPNGAQEGRAVKNILGQYTVEDAIGCYHHMKQDPFWDGKHLSLATVHKNIGAWKAPPTVATPGGYKNGRPPPMTKQERNTAALREAMQEMGLDV